MISDDAARSPAARTTAGPGSAKRIRRTALASTYFMWIVAHRAKRRLDVHAPIELGNRELCPVLRTEPETAFTRQPVAPRERLTLRRAKLRYLLPAPPLHHCRAPPQ